MFFTVKQHGGIIVVTKEVEGSWQGDSWFYNPSDNKEDRFFNLWRVRNEIIGQGYSAKTTADRDLFYDLLLHYC